MYQISALGFCIGGAGCTVCPVSAVSPFSAIPVQFQPPGPPCGVGTYAGEQLLADPTRHLGWTRRKRVSYPGLNTLLLGTTTAIRAHSAVMPPIWPCVHRCTPHGRWRRRQLASAKQACTWQFATGSGDKIEYKHRPIRTSPAGDVAVTTADGASHAIQNSNTHSLRSLPPNTLGQLGQLV